MSDRLKIETLSVGYSRNLPLLKDINVSEEAGKLVALFGENGVGKSTLLKTLSGMLAPLHGNVEVDSKDVYSVGAQERSKLISLVTTERMWIDSMMVYDLVALGRAPYTGLLGKILEEDKHVINRVVSQLSIENLLERKFDLLSDGEKQKVLIARALCQDTPVLILDEPTAFLDYKAKNTILHILKEIAAKTDKVIVFSSHDISNSLSVADSCWMMTGGNKLVVARGEENKQRVEKLLLAN